MTCNYTGRFAPSPTGPLHFGSIIAALASYLRSRSLGGKWLLRIDDIDTPRNQPGAANSIMHTLEALGLWWDGEVVFQSHRVELYKEILNDLDKRQLLYPCSCSRSEIKGRPYPGTCRNGITRKRKNNALRIRTDSRQIHFNDLIQGEVEQCIEKDVGDFILKRTDGLIAYHLATVIDDHLQGVTEVMRGTDLLDSTPRQIFLQQVLGYEHPQYFHHAVAINPSGTKISKQNHAPGIDISNGAQALFEALVFLGQEPDPSLTEGACGDIVSWALQHWRLDTLPQENRIVIQEF